MAFTLEHSRENQAVRDYAAGLIADMSWQQAWQERQHLVAQAKNRFPDIPPHRVSVQVHAAIRQIHPQDHQHSLSMPAERPDTEHQIYLGDCLDVARDLWPRFNGKFQLLLTSTPYPGLAGFNLSVVEYLEWWRDRLEVLLPLLNQKTGMVAQNIKFARSNGWYDNAAERSLTLMYERFFEMHCVDRFIWDKVNVPPRGNLEAHDPDGWEYVFVYAFGPGYQEKYNHFYGDYSRKTILKAGSAAGMRSTDVRGKMGNGHNTLSEKGAIQSNIIRASNSGGVVRPRVAGGVFPVELPVRMISQLTEPGDWVLDPMAGSFTTNVVAHWLGRNSVGVDIDPNAVLVGAGWLAQETGKPAQEFRR